MALVENDSANPIRKAVQVLRQGGVVAFPTETTYGIGCDPRDSRAVRRIFRLKGRTQNNALLLVASSLEQAEAVAIFDEINMDVAKRYWPGPLTLILPARREADLARGATVAGTLAIRVSSSEIVRRLTHAFGFPIVATSANLSGQEEARSADKVRELFGERIDVIIDGGLLPKRAVSTVAKISTDGKVEIIRKGAVRLPKFLA